MERESKEDSVAPLVYEEASFRSSSADPSPEIDKSRRRNKASANLSMFRPHDAAKEMRRAVQGLSKRPCNTVQH